MLTKLKTECREYNYIWKIPIWLILAYLSVRICLSGMLVSYPDASLGEYVVYALTNYNHFLVLIPIILISLTSSRYHQVCRYPILLRYRNRNEFFCMRIVSKAGFCLWALTTYILLVLIAGRSLPVASAQTVILSTDYAGIVLRQFLNMQCYFCVLLLLHEIVNSIIGNILADIMVTALVPLANLIIWKLHLLRILRWTPWGNVGYMIWGQEQVGYQFYWWYWLFLFLVLFYVADELNGRKDYVFEEARKVN